MDLIWHVVVALSYWAVIGGCTGMIAFAQVFPSSTHIRDLRLASERFLRLNGYQVWIVSWSLITGGTTIQFVDYVLRL